MATRRETSFNKTKGEEMGGSEGQEKKGKAPFK